MKHKKIQIIIGLFILITFLFIPNITSAQSQLFSDVTDTNAYYYNAVYWAKNNNIANGYTRGQHKGKFGYDLTCTRAHVITFLWRYAGKPEPKTQNNPFKDINKSDYYYKAVLWAAENGIAKGYADGTFRPNDDCLREHVITFLWRYAGRPNLNTKKNPFNDIDKKDYYYNATLWANKNKIANGYSTGKYKGGFGPKLDCTRAHVITFLWRYAGKPIPNDSSISQTEPTCKHQWVTKTKHHNEVGHWENKAVKEAWDEKIQVGTKTVIDQEAWDEIIVDKEAWDEVVGYKEAVICMKCYKKIWGEGKTPDDAFNNARDNWYIHNKTCIDTDTDIW